MIVRISSIAIPKTEVARYFDHVQSDLVPAYRGAPGFDSLYFLHRSLIAYEEVLTVSFWQSEADLVHFVQDSAVEHGLREVAAIEFAPRSYRLLMSCKGQEPE